ncbi:hypothetical protein ACHRVK_06905 [Flavobacterium plurextorum]|uniref:hypothetical protein n=1 Tax=Flavobacterium TaxID=237 RepID=UPI000C19AA91|nr:MULTISPECIES: hypothetical protein [Flavobacterium]PIF69528.1 hypothetical protein CLU99_0235 [Flavobacterium sp. 2]UUW10379.1 hypothetical protein NLG42_06125 [Flavobacterium plurextorum]
MLKNILNLEGSQEITASEQKTIIGTNVKEATSKCDTWYSRSGLTFEDCAEYYSLDLNYASVN